MRKLTALLSLCLLMGANESFAKVWTVNNAPVSSANFKDINTAMTAASAGDTLYIVGSAVNYGPLNITKGLTLIGQGHHPANVAQKSSAIGTVNIMSDNVNIIGFSITGNINSVKNGNFTTPVNNVRIERNESKYPIYTGDSAHNWIIANNFLFGRSIKPDTIFTGRAGCTNILIYNNFFNNYDVMLFYNGVTIKNNLFYNCTMDYLKYASIDNNIIIVDYVNSKKGTFSYNKVNNNITLKNYATKSPAKEDSLLKIGTNNTGSGNIYSKDPGFINAVDFNNPYSKANNWQISSTSPAHNAGTDGTDLGPWGGSLPFVTVGGEPALPVITDFRINNPAVPLNGKLNISVKVKKIK